MALCFTMFWSGYRVREREGKKGGRKARMALCFTMFWSDYSSWLGRGRGRRGGGKHAWLFASPCSGVGVRGGGGGIKPQHGLELI